MEYKPIKKVVSGNYA
nr:keto-valine-ferredoxin oxidoreductase alpha-subunit, VOR alpha {N-terminal} [Pyrococcus, ES-4, Peptide Partial, 15 aa] [Pyrococcus]